MAMKSTLGDLSDVGFRERMSPISAGIADPPTPRIISSDNQVTIFHSTARFL